MSLVDMKQLLARAANLAPLPEAVQRVLHLSREEDTTAHDIVEAVKVDPVVVARILKLANSSLYSRSEAAGSLDEAAASLGVEKLVDLVLATCASRWFQGAPTTASERQQAWERAYASALAASLLARVLGDASPGRAYTAALVADFGALIMAPELLENADDIAALLATGGRPDEAERAVLGTDHASLGALVLARYSFPPVIVDAVRHHHAPQDARYDAQLAWCVHFGQLVALDMLAQKNGGEALQLIDEAELAAVGMDLAGIVGLEELLQRELDRTADLMRLGA